MLQCLRIMVMMLATQVCTLILLHPATQGPPFPTPSTNSHYPLQAPGPVLPHIPLPGSPRPPTLRMTPGRWRRGVSGRAGGMQMGS